MGGIAAAVIKKKRLVPSGGIVVPGGIPTKCPPSIGGIVDANGII